MIICIFLTSATFYILFWTERLFISLFSMCPLCYGKHRACIRCLEFLQYIIWMYSSVLIPLSALVICYLITGTLVFFFCFFLPDHNCVLLCDHVTLIHEIWIIQFTWLRYFVMCWEKCRIAQGLTLLLSD